jgi:hypothetical protein
MFRSERPKIATSKPIIQVMNKQDLRTVREIVIVRATLTVHDDSS